MNLALAVQQLLEQDRWLRGHVTIGPANTAAPYVVIWPTEQVPGDTRHGGVATLAESTVIVHAVGETIEQAALWYQRVRACLTPPGDLILADGYALQWVNTAGPIRDTDANPELWSFALELNALERTTP